ncbi:hypothetical protein AALP_AA1G098700 [Arabis alpina]|uniref:Uncharacterized protein n=1 Tax=Arabis alpina TaxID=50452 RepID=A0A087HM94_ARAAL|nr:hypothetical protein AALP_AA1G098700 [Arabis alpina]
MTGKFSQPVEVSPTSIRLIGSSIAARSSSPAVWVSLHWTSPSRFVVVQMRAIFVPA